MRIRRRLFAMVSITIVLAGCKDSGDSTLEECKNVDFLFDSDECLDALSTRCRAFATEADCWAAEPMEVAAGSVGDYAYCVWTNVATVADVQTCEIGETFGRCEAALPGPWDGLGNTPACVDGEFSVEGRYTAFVDDLELVDSWVTAPDGTGYQWWTSSSATTCAENVSTPEGSPPRPEWCSCAPAACSATSE
jgi:hypothetical protein